MSGSRSGYVEHSDPSTPALRAYAQGERGALGRGDTLMDYFDIFGIPPSVDLDPAALEQQFRELSLKLHPDRWAHAPAKERLVALEKSTSLNEAFRTLKDPIRRAFYLLKQRGVDLDREDAGAQKGMPLDFLEEVMTLRESLDGLREAGDLAGAQAMAKDAATRQKAALEEAFTALRAQGPEATQKASHALARVRYFTRFLEEVERMEEEAL